MKTIKEAAKELRQESLIVLGASKTADYVTCANREYAAFVKGAKFAQRWIPVEEELPPVGELVQIKFMELLGERICYDHDKTIEVHDSSRIFDCEQCAVKVIGWRPIELKP